MDNSNTYYLGIIAAFNRKVTVLKDGSTYQEDEVAMPLISVSPILHRPNGFEDESEN